MGLDWNDVQDDDRERKRRGPRRPPNYLSRRMQHRLFALTAMLMLLIMAMQHARRPETWHWLWLATGASPPDAPSAQVLHSREQEPQTAGRDGAKRHSDGWPPGIDRTLLEDVTDDTYFHRDEQQAWFHLFKLLEDQTNKVLQSHSLGRASYLQLNGQTEVYRGRLVNIDGVVRRAHQLNAPANRFGIESYWQCWLFPIKGPKLPIVVYLLEAPVELDAGMEIEFPIKLTGIVYKRWAFRSG